MIELKATVWEMMYTLALDIDNEEDLELMEIIGKYNMVKYEGYGEMFERVKKLIK